MIRDDLIGLALIKIDKGKNQGRPLGDLTTEELGWYAANSQNSWIRQACKKLLEYMKEENEGTPNNI